MEEAIKVRERGAKMFKKFFKKIKVAKKVLAAVDKVEDLIKNNKGKYEDFKNIVETVKDAAPELKEHADAIIAILKELKNSEG